MSTVMELSLWPACVKAHPFSAQLDAAIAGGFDRLPIAPFQYRTLREAGTTAREIRAMARDRGVRLGHYDGLTDWAPLRFGAAVPAAARAVLDFSTDDCLQMCEELELPAICATGAFAPGEVETPALVDGFGAFCARAAAIGVHVDLEFLPMWGIPDLALAWQIVREAGCANSGVLFDTWHFFRGNPDLGLLRELPAGVIRTVQLADAPLALQGGDLFEDTLRFRKVPGEGELALPAVLAVLAEKGGVENIGPEVYSDEMDGLDATEAALRNARAMRTLLAAAGMRVRDAAGND